MKFSLKELLDTDNILSHIFLESIGEHLENIANSIKGKQEEEKSINIELKINGYDCNPESFFNSLWERYKEYVKEQAIEIIKQNTSDKFNDLSNKISEDIESITEIINSWTNEINWDIKNPLKKEGE